MNKVYRPETQSKVYDILCNFFVNLKKKDIGIMKEFVTIYNKLANIAKKNNMQIPSTVLWLKLLPDLNIDATDRKLVMTN